MRLLTGPAGSGKTTQILNNLRDALKAGRSDFRLLVPTATLAQHLQNLIAREGFVLFADMIQTLSGFVDKLVQDTPQVPETVLSLMVDECARRVNRPEFAGVVETAGFCARMARTIGEFSSAGCDSARLAAVLPDSPLSYAFLEVYREVERELAARSLAMRARRLELAAAAIDRAGTGDIRTIWLDGFHALPEPELRVIGALARQSDLTLTLSDSDVTARLRSRLLAWGFHEERIEGTHRSPVVKIVRASGLEREVEEIARRILEQVEGGLAFRDIGIVVRSQDSYVPLLRSTLERFGIPARFYFEQRLDQHAAIRYLTGAVDAMMDGWEHEATLQVLRLAPRFADLTAMDRFDFAVREQIPGAGLGTLHTLAQESAPLQHKIDSLKAIEEWRSFALMPEDWSARLRLLRNLFRPARPQTHGRIERYGLAEALDAFDEALDEAALALEGPAVGLEQYWRAVKSVLRLAPLRIRDDRRNVVNVIAAHEARQWELPVVFVCGMVEKSFPQFHVQDPFFPESARLRLNAAGVPVRTAFEFEREERGLFDSALTRATSQVVLSYPEFDARGQANLRSLFLEGRTEEEEIATPVRPEPRYEPPGGLREGLPSPELRSRLAEKWTRFGPSRLEDYVQCPFRYFGKSILKLTTRPQRPEDRLDFMTQGLVVHRVLQRLYTEGGDVASLFEEEFARTVEDKQLPPGYHRERLYNSMLDDLLAYSRSDLAPKAGPRSQMEQEFEFEIAEGVRISGKIDRFDVDDANRATVIDYKYSSVKNMKDRGGNDDLLQAPLYLLAAEKFFHLDPVGMMYAGLKGGVLLVEWKDGVLPDGWRDTATQRTVEIVGQIRGGHMEVRPADRKKCRFCDSKDVCRVSGIDEVDGEGEPT